MVATEYRKRALITGANSGLGAVLSLVLSDRRYEVVGAVQGSAEPPEIAMTHVSYEATRPADEFIARLQIAGENIPFDVVVNCAGINAIRMFDDLDAEFIHEIMQVNFVAPVMLTQALMHSGLLQQPSIIVNIVSDAAWRPMRHSLAYGCSKAALDLATKQMARELTKVKPYPTFIGIRPGFMEGTTMSHYIEAQVCTMRGWLTSEARAYAANARVANEALKATDVARLIADIIGNDSVHALSGTCMDLAG